MGNFAMSNGGIISENSDGPGLRMENDYYPTPPYVSYALSQIARLDSIWEPAAGRGWMAREFVRLGKKVIATDLVDYPNKLVPVTSGIDFLEAVRQPVDAVVTNPPYAKDMAQKFVEKALTFNYPLVAVLCRLNFAESRNRYPLFQDFPPSEVHVFSRRFSCAEWFFGKDTGKWVKDEADDVHRLFVEGPEGWEDDPEVFDDPFSGMVSFAWWLWRPKLKAHPTTMHWIDSDATFAGWKASFGGKKYERYT